MENATCYSYQLSGRRPGTFLALALCGLMLAFAAYHGAPWYFLAPVVIGGALALWTIIANPQTGSKLTAKELRLSNRGKQETIALADVAHMAVRNWTDGPDTVALTLATGRVVQVPSPCADSKLAVALRDLGVRELK